MCGIATCQVVCNDLTSHSRLHHSPRELLNLLSDRPNVRLVSLLSCFVLTEPTEPLQTRNLNNATNPIIFVELKQQTKHLSILLKDGVRRPGDHHRGHHHHPIYLQIKYEEVEDDIRANMAGTGRNGQGDVLGTARFSKPKERRSLRRNGIMSTRVELGK